MLLAVDRCLELVYDTYCYKQLFLTRQKSVVKVIFVTKKYL